MSGSGAKRALTAAEAYSLLLHVRYPLEIYETSSPGDLFRGLFLERGGIMISVGTKGDIRMPIAAAKIFGCSQSMVLAEKIAGGTQHIGSTILKPF